MGDHGTVRVVVAAPDSETAKQLEAEFMRLEAEDVDVQPEGAGIIDPVTLATVGSIVVSATIQVVHFAVWIKNWWDRRGKAGAFIDARGDDLKVVESSVLGPGQIVVVAKDGTMTEHLDTDPAGIDDWSTKVVEGLPSGGKATSATEITAKAGADAG